MKEYKLVVGMNTYIVNSRDAKNWASQYGQPVEVYSMTGKLLSKADIDENGKPYSVYIGDGE